MTDRTHRPFVCPFCTLPAGRLIDQTDLALVIRDAYPVSPGHTLVLPIRHVESIFVATDAERSDIMTLLDRAKRDLDRELAPAGFNIGINDGAAAGQTVPHLHVHLIPRYPRDQPDPRGGIRWIVPERARYWSE